MDYIGENEIICQPDPERVIEGLRDTGYNFNTAMADIIDNSIAANATRIIIKIFMAQNDHIQIYIADNGIGMDSEGLINAMKYGSKVRPDLASLGKFGLGLKTASTAFCRCLSVVTRYGENGNINKAQWDLDYVAETNAWKLRMPAVTEDEKDLLDEVTEGKSGTIVVWDKVDRLIKNSTSRKSAQNALSKKIEDLRFYVSMVYQRFLNEKDSRAQNVQIFINEKEVEAWDAFTEKEPNHMMAGADTVTVNMPDGSSPSFTMRAFVLPRPEQFSSEKAKSEARVNNDLQGFYIYRENRLINYGDWFGIYTKDSHRSLLRVEFSFNHDLDEAFNVDIKKSRILPADEIVSYIKEKFISPPARAATTRYREGENNKITSGNTASAHDASNKNIEGKADKVEGSKITIVDADADKVSIQNKNGTFTSTIKITSAPKKDKCYVIPEPSLTGDQLWEPTITNDGKHAVRINQSHPYYQKIYYPVINESVMVTGMDALLWALAEAENSTFNEETRDEYEDMRYTVSKILKKLVSDLPDPQLGNEEDE